MKCVSFNVNSIRMRLPQLHALIEKHAPDFIGLQETKVTDPDFPIQDILNMGYHVEFFGQKTHYGVALMSKHPFIRCTKGFASDEDDAQRRFITGEFELPSGEKITVMNGYFPQGESRDHPTKFPNKQRFYENLTELLSGEISSTANIIVMGDMNISPADIDIGIGEPNRKRWLKTGKCSFLPEEREWLQRIYDLGFVDTFRDLNPETEDAFSWFDYRSRGFEQEPKRGLRIDLVLANIDLAKKAVNAGIDYDIRAMEKPSDHAPIWTEFSL